MVHPTNKQGVISSHYGMRNGRPHLGTDIAGFGKLKIHASWSGTVTTAFKGCVKGNLNCGDMAGNYVTIKHNKSLYTRYLHLRNVYVKKGQKVKAGQLIGLEGSTGYSTGEHLHFEIIKNGKKINPLPYLQKASYVGAINNNQDKILLIALGAFAFSDEILDFLEL